MSFTQTFAMHSRHLISTISIRPSLISADTLQVPDTLAQLRKDIWLAICARLTPEIPDHLQQIHSLTSCSSIALRA